MHIYRKLSLSQINEGVSARLCLKLVICVYHFQELYMERQAGG